MTRYYECKFRDEDTRTYAYHFDGDDDLAPGDRVRVEMKDREKTVIVAMALDVAPTFATKPILGRKVETEEELLA